MLGDYIDRGPDSKGVIDLIWELQESGHSIYCLRGNHEQMLLDSLDNNSQTFGWVKHGGFQTLQSFNVRIPELIKEKYISWLRELPYYFEVDNYILVHAGLDFDMNNPLKDEQSMLWIRHWHHLINKNWLGDRIVVHGHTPVNKDEVKKAIDLLDEIPALDIDAGCVFIKRGLGHLCAFDMTNKKLYFQYYAEVNSEIS